MGYKGYYALPPTGVGLRGRGKLVSVSESGTIHMSFSMFGGREVSAGH